MTGIYSIHNIITDKYYIGQAGDIKFRWMQHKSRLRCGNHENKHLQASYDMYGEENFKYDIVKECTKEELDDKEIYYIKEYDSYCNGYNQDKGGAGCKGYKHSDEEIMKMRMIQNPKAVLQLNMDLNIVAEWISCSHAGKTLNLNIRGIKACCERINHQKTIGGYYWVYKEEYDNNTLDWNYLVVNTSIPQRVSQYTLDMQLIKIWDSMYAASKENGFSQSQIIKNCRFKSKTAYNFVWRLTDEYTDEQYKIDCATDFKPTMDNTPLRISQYDLNMNLIRIWDSLNSIYKETNWNRSNIATACKNSTATSHNFVWRFTDIYTDEQHQMDLNTVFKPTRSVVPKPVLQYSMDGVLIARYSSKQAASKATGLHSSTINSRCLGLVKDFSDFIFKYE